jgi:ketosteroid isomerase-like protein
MPQENVEVVRQVFKAWNNDDIDAALLVLHPDAEFHRASAGFPGNEDFYRGHAGIREWWRLNKEPWD